MKLGQEFASRKVIHSPLRIGLPGNTLIARINLSRHLLSQLALIIMVFLALLPDEVFARAGGGRASGAGLLGLILLPFFAIYSAIVTYYAVKKYRQAKHLLARIEVADEAWNLNSIKARIEQAYFAIQYAWRDRDPESAREFMSDRLYTNHKIQLDQMIRGGTRNEMEAISLSSVKVLEVMDYVDDSRDSFVALIDGSMTDKLVRDDGTVVDGDNKKRAFQELWKFKREPRGWVLDEIDSDVSISDVSELQAWSESRS